MSQRSRRNRRRGGAPSKVLFVGGAVLALIAALAIGVTSWVLDVAADAPSLSSCKPVEEGGNSILYDGDGEKLGVVASDEARTPVALRRMPQELRQATIGIEDERFYEHGGVDSEAILRAAVKDLEAGEAVEGGSTITQQLVRNLCIPDPDDDLERKIIEAQLAVEYSKRHSKDEILGQYLNTASYGTVNGSTAIGVQAASRIYFSRPVWKLSLTQAAMLAGLPQAPTDYNPILNPAGARERRDEVLAKMADLGYVSPAEAATAEDSGLGLDVAEGFYKHRQPYFFDYVEDKLIEAYGVNTVRQGGLDVYTTIDPELQRVGIEAMRSALPYEEDPSSAFVSIDPRNGWIRAMVSSSSYDSSQFNLAAQGHRQPGSTFKTFVLTTALKQGVDPYSTYYVSKPLSIDTGQWGHWDVHTADEGYLGSVNLQQATVASDNTVFAQLDLDVGPEQVAETAHSMGITSPLDGIPAEGIGGLRVGVSPLEMSSAYATLAAGGIRRDPVAIRRVVFPGGRVEEPEKPRPRRVVSEAVAYEVTRLLHDNITEGTGTAAYTGCEGQAGKTGTTDRLTDAWFAGYQPNLSTVVWVGYPQSNEIEMTSVHGISVFGGTFPAEIWHSVYANGEVPCETFSEPEKPIVWAPFYGRFTRGGPTGDSIADAAGKGEELPGQDYVGGYDPNAYAPGAGQEPYVPPAPPPAQEPAPSGGDEGVGVGEESPSGGAEAGGGEGG
jgi:penicillin-binding protein 1A